MTVEQTLRVISIRSQNPHGFGGCIFSGKPIGEQGQVLDAGAYSVVNATAATLGGCLVQPGQWWKVSGEASSRSLDVNGFRLAETQIEAATAVLLRPSGEHLVAFMAECPAFEGIGQVKARKLWETFGEGLYVLLDTADAKTLSTVLTPDIAAVAVAAWAQYGNSRTLQWLQAQGFELGLGRKVLQFFGAQTQAKLEEDPYRLLSFCGTWRKVDKLAQSHFGIKPDDPRRLQGAVEEACYRIFAAGHTTALSTTLMNYLQGVLGTQTANFKWRGLIPTALSQGLSNGSFVIGHHGVQPLGALVLERQVAQAVASRLIADAEPLLPVAEVMAVLSRYEEAEGIELNAEQRHAVQLAADKAFTLITGGAGVGKTTVLKALYEVYDRAGVTITQVALAGRAAKRMQEATGRPASTIANFLRSWKDSSLSGRCVVVVDEASMVDIISMSRLCEMLALSVRLVLVGDPAQLMPVGPGLVLHALAQVPQVPLAELKVVKRYGGDIATAATAIRAGRWPQLSTSKDAPVAFIACRLSALCSDEGSLPDTVLRLYRDDPSRTQILCARRGGEDGSKGLNALCQAALTVDAQPVVVWSDQHAQYVRTGLHLGDPVLCTRNIWDRGLQNGSLGIIVQVEDEPKPLTDASGDDAGFALAWVDWDDGVRRPLVEEMLDDIELGYAITVHKAQGSQWPRVIVPVTGHRLLDRTMVYTAVTRAQKQVLLVGDETAARAAVVGLPRAQSRQVALDLSVRAQLPLATFIRR
jgi:exodeoxyribonuclease V alpha subunit